jgi:hypothetical protein
MNAQIEPARSRHPAVVAASVVAGLVFIAGALLVIAYMLGWFPAKPPLPGAPTAMASPGQQVTGSAPDVALLPGETLVSPPEAPPRAPDAGSKPPLVPRITASQPAAPQPTTQEPLTPQATPQQPATPQPTTPQPTAPKYATTPPPESPRVAAAPSRPNYTRDEVTAHASSERPAQDVCVNCGAVTAIGSSGSDWEVRVRFDDGSSESLHYPERPRLRVGDRVRLEDDRLVPDR